MEYKHNPNEYIDEQYIKKQIELCLEDERKETE